MRKKLAVAVVALLCAVSCTSPSNTYVMADRATFEAVAFEYEGYVNADDAMDQEAKDRRMRTIDTWRRRLESAEGNGR